MLIDRYIYIYSSRGVTHSAGTDSPEAAEEALLKVTIYIYI